MRCAEKLGERPRNALAVDEVAARAVAKGFSPLGKLQPGPRAPFVGRVIRIARNVLQPAQFVWGKGPRGGVYRQKTPPYAYGAQGYYNLTSILAEVFAEDLPEHDWGYFFFF